MKTNKMLIPILLIAAGVILLIFTFAIPFYYYIPWQVVTIDDLVEGDNWFSASRLEIDCSSLGERVNMSVSNELEEGIKITLDCGSLGIFRIYNEDNPQRLKIKLTALDDRIVYYADRIPIIECYLRAGNDYYGAAYESGGNATIYCGPGDDSIWSGNGNDWIYGHDGDDEIDGGGGQDVIVGGNGRDHLEGGDGYDVIHGGSGWDSIGGGNGADQLMGNIGNDTIHGGLGDDSIWGHDQNDTIDGGGGNDYIDGGAGDDTLRGSQGDDHLMGGPGDDYLHGWLGIDRIEGGPGRDTFHDDSLATGYSTYDEIEDYDRSTDTIE